NVDQSDDTTATDNAVGDVGDEDTSLVGADETVPAAPPSTATAGMTAMKTTANLNLRKGPGTSFGILLVIPSGTTVSLVSTTQQNGFYNVTYSGSTGWA